MIMYHLKHFICGSCQTWRLSGKIFSAWEKKGVTRRKISVLTILHKAFSEIEILGLYLNENKTIEFENMKGEMVKRTSSIEAYYGINVHFEKNSNFQLFQIRKELK